MLESNGLPSCTPTPIPTSTSPLELALSQLSANATADYLIDCCYSLQDEDLYLYSDCYTLKGLVLLMAQPNANANGKANGKANTGAETGDPYLMDDVEDYLQKAARWAQDNNPTQMIRTLNNLGYLSLCKCKGFNINSNGNTPVPVPVLSNLAGMGSDMNTDTNTHSLFRDYFVTNTNTNATSTNTSDTTAMDSETDRAHCLDAMGYFQEAIALGKKNTIFGSGSSSSGTGSGAAGMCGLPVDGGAEVDMTGLGKEAVFVNSEGGTSSTLDTTTTGTSASTSTRPTAVAMKLDENLQNVSSIVWLVVCIYMCDCANYSYTYLSIYNYPSSHTYRLRLPWLTGQHKPT